MKMIFLVPPDVHAKALEIENRLVSLSKQSGILFASVTASIEEPVTFKIVVGCTRELEKQTVKMLIAHSLGEEIKEGTSLSIEVHRGTSRK